MSLFRESTMIRRYVYATLTAISVHAWSPPALAQTAGSTSEKSAEHETPQMREAQERYARGLQLFAEKNVEAARIEFKKAYELAPAYLILYNIGVCDAALNDYVSAVSSLKRYLEQGGSQVTEQRKTEVATLLSQLEPKIAQVMLTVNVPGATISVDDVPVAVSPLKEPIAVNSGRRRISASKPGHFPATQSIAVAGKERIELSLQLESVERPAASAAPQKSPRIAPYVLWGATGALAIGAGVTGIVALNAASKQRDLLDRPTVTKGELDDNRSTMRTFGIAADILTVAAVATGGVALYVTLKRPSPDPEPAPKPAASIRILPNGVAVSGAF